MLGVRQYENEEIFNNNRVANLLFRKNFKNWLIFGAFIIIIKIWRPTFWTTVRCHSVCL